MERAGLAEEAKGEVTGEGGGSEEERGRNGVITEVTLVSKYEYPASKTIKQS